MLRRLNDALPDLVLGIIVYGVLAELIGVWFVTDKVRYSTGLLIGISLAVGMAIHIAVVIRDAGGSCGNKIKSKNGGDPGEF